jgi:hypothetical protein
MTLNILVLKDKDANDIWRELAEVASLYKDYASLDIKWTIEDFDYTNAEASTTNDHFDSYSQRWLREECKKVYKKYAEDIDHVIFLVHEDKFEFKLPDGRNLWGENFSNIFSGYQVQICRYDKNNQANTVGTIYHEMHHSHEAFTYKYTGKDVEKMLGYDWDRITHGTIHDWKYIRYKENARSLTYIGPLMHEAVAARRKLWNQKKLGYLTQILALSQQLITLLRNRKKTK